MGEKSFTVFVFSFADDTIIQGQGEQSAWRSENGAWNLQAKSESGSIVNKGKGEEAFGITHQEPAYIEQNCFVMQNTIVLSTNYIKLQVACRNPLSILNQIIISARVSRC